MYICIYLFFVDFVFVGSVLLGICGLIKVFFESRGRVVMLLGYVLVCAECRPVTPRVAKTVFDYRPLHNRGH